MSEEKQISCSVCGELFTPLRKNHRRCGNYCNVITYQAREKVRKLLMKLQTPEQLAALEVFAETLVIDAYRHQELIETLKKVNNA